MEGVGPERGTGGNYVNAVLVYEIIRKKIKI